MTEWKYVGDIDNKDGLYSCSACRDPLRLMKRYATPGRKKTQIRGICMRNGCALFHKDQVCDLPSHKSYVPQPAFAVCVEREHENNLPLRQLAERYGGFPGSGELSSCFVFESEENATKFYSAAGSYSFSCAPPREVLV